MPILTVSDSQGNLLLKINFTGFNFPNFDSSPEISQHTAIFIKFFFYYKNKYYKINNFFLKQIDRK